MPEVWIVVRSTFQTWFGRSATMVRPDVDFLLRGGEGGGETLPGRRRARRTVVGPTWSAARESRSAIRRAPIVGATALSERITSATKGGKRLMGRGGCTKVESCSSARLVHVARVTAVIKNRRAATSKDYPRAVLSTKMANRSCGR